MTTLKQAIDQAGEAEKHADPIDTASDRTQQEISHLLRENAARVIEQNAAAIAQTTGRCLHCDESVEANRRWCDRYCASEWERNRGRRDV